MLFSGGGMPLDFRKMLGKRALIVGEAGSGKTRVLASFLDFLVERGLEREVTLIELAPGLEEIGRPLETYTRNVFRVRYLRPRKIYPPRLLGKTAEEVLSYAERNYREARRLLSIFSASPSKILLINDLTTFLHFGNPEEILEAIRACETFAATAYEGEVLRDDKGSGITMREKKALSRLKPEMDLVIKLSKS